jgi:formamidopyrimidine-DNA glycosylase
MVLHLMIAGRLRWREPGEKPGIGSKLLLVLFEFEHGTLLFTEAGSRKRASIQLVRGEAVLRSIDRGGVEPLDTTRDQFREALLRENHISGAHRPRLFSGIGNAYRRNPPRRRLPPQKLSRALTDGDRIALRRDAVNVDRLDCATCAAAADGFEKVTA